MSPLARSLLAIAALLVAATTALPPNCSQELVGQKGIPREKKSVHVPAPAGPVDDNWPPGTCQSLGDKFLPCGEHIVACNTNDFASPPMIMGGMWADHDVVVDCKINYDECYPGGIDVTLTVQCCSD